MKYLLPILIAVFLLGSSAGAQTGYIFTGAKNIKAPHPPKPEDFKTKELSWGEMDSECRTEVISHGNWFKIYPNTTKLQIVVETGMPFGTITDPFIYIGTLDTVNGFESLVQHACAKHQGAMGQFKLEAFNLTPERLYYLLIGGNAKKQTFGLYLTESFSPENPPPPPPPEEKPEEEAIPSENQASASEKDQATRNVEEQVQIQPDGQALILGRLRNKDGNPLNNTKVMLLNDDLQQVQEVSTDEYGGFRFEGVNPDKINLVKMSKDDSKWLIDMFMYDQDFEVIGKPIPLGHRLHSFKAREDYFRDLRILTEDDVFVNVEQGGSYMTGKVVDKETYLVGREGVKVGLYNNTKNLVKTAITDLNGRFSFMDLENEDYIVKVEHNPDRDYVEIVIADSLNVPYATTNSNSMDADGYFKFKALPPEIVELRRMEVMEDRGMLTELTEEPKALIDEEKVGVAIELASIEFNTGSSKLTLAKNKELDQLAEELIEKETVHIKIDGHTDNVGSPDDNLRLSNERADAVKSYLVSHGVASSRIEAQGFGSSQPVASNDTEEGRSKNRRVEFTIVQ